MGWKSVLLAGMLIGLIFAHRSSAYNNSPRKFSEPSPFNFNFTVGTEEKVSLTFRRSTTLTLTVNATDFYGDVELRSADPDIFSLEDDVRFTISESDTLPFNKSVILRGRFVGASALGVYANISIGNREEIFELAPAVLVNVFTPFKTVGDTATIILTCWLMASYVIMAAKVEPRVLKSRIKPPWAIIVGMVCQFVLMPPLAYCIAKVFDLEGALAVGLVLVGTCPGGFFSNIEVLLLNCDLVLSLTMTTFSTFLAVAMMPLNLKIYAEQFIDDEGKLETPFLSLIIQLAGLVVPLVVGIPFFYKFPKARSVCLKLVKPFAFILMLMGLVLFIPSQYYVFFGSWKVWITSAILPLLGAFLGISIARIANFDYNYSITVAIETGCQNTLLAVSVAKLYYQQPESDIVSIIPLLISMVTGFEGILIAIGYSVYRLLKSDRQKKTENRDNVDIGPGQAAGECNLAGPNGGSTLDPESAQGEQVAAVRYIVPSAVYAESASYPEKAESAIGIEGVS